MLTVLGADGRVLARTTVRLCLRDDTSEAVISADQPLYAPGVNDSGGGEGEGGGERDDLEEALRSQAVQLSEMLRVPMLWWRECARPLPVADIDDVLSARGAESSGGEEEEEKGAARCESTTTTSGRPCLIECDGEAPLVYSNLAGLIERGHARTAVLAEVR